MIYFAAPLSKDEDARRNEEYATRLRAAGLHVFLPQELGRVADKPRPPEERQQLRHYYFREDMKGLDYCDILFMFLAREASAGACWEMGYSYGKQKTIIGFNMIHADVGTFLSQSCDWYTDWDQAVEALWRATDADVRSILR
jgi:nucleoside 2-deoxyribosyltransferase